MMKYSVLKFLVLCFGVVCGTGTYQNGAITNNIDPADFSDQCYLLAPGNQWYGGASNNNGAGIPLPFTNYLLNVKDAETCRCLCTLFRSNKLPDPEDEGDVESGDTTCNFWTYDTNNQFDRGFGTCYMYTTLSGSTTPPLFGPPIAFWGAPKNGLTYDTPSGTPCDKECKLCTSGYSDEYGNDATYSGDGYAGKKGYASYDIDVQKYTPGAYDSSSGNGASTYNSGGQYHRQYIGSSSSYTNPGGKYSSSSNSGYNGGGNYKRDNYKSGNYNSGSGSSYKRYTPPGY